MALAPTHLIFDLDNTLYPRQSGLFDRINERISLYLKINLNIAPDNVEPLRKEYMKKFGTTLGGLIRFHQVDPDHFLEFVHEVPLKDYLTRDPDLPDIISAAKGHKSVFTNGSLAHGERVLEFLGLQKLFSDIFDIKFMDYQAKPFIASYRKMLDALRAEPERCVIIDDMPINLEPAKELKMITVLVGAAANNSFDYHIEHINQISRVFRDLGIYP